VPKLCERGYRVRVLDRLYFGEDGLKSVRDQTELIAADMRKLPDGILDGIDGVINLSGLSNDPTAEFKPEAKWEMNAIATETLGRACPRKGIERYVFTSSFSLYDGLPPVRELAMIVAGSVQLTGRPASLEEVSAPKPMRDFECANAKLSTRLGFIPRRSVLEAVSNLLARIGDLDQAMLTDRR